ncbi:hypothetical protein LCGC14_2076890 [marine sediment metagenome]|uniref:Uncharacterized protein n=1 Tax=marine sediment metagenome TaxID=412755 RepID=A0A0F9F444_9ZZZZ
MRVKHLQQTVVLAVQVAPARLVLRNRPLVAVAEKAGMAPRLSEGEAVALPPSVLRDSMAAVVARPT